MKVIEAMDYIKELDMKGVSLTDAGRASAISILEHRKDWTPSHGLMLDKVAMGIDPLPFKLARLVSRTRLGDAIDLVRDLNRQHIRNQKCRARRRAARVRRAAA